MANIIGIRREDKNPWERRVPLIPSHIREIKKSHGLKFIVQPSPIRVFADDDFKLEGATVQESLSPCQVIMAVKEVPIPLFEPGKAYMFFSHTIKGQPGKMPMLRHMVEQGCTLIDYERIVDGAGRRLVFFGRQAGEAGMVDTLWALGRRLVYEGLENPFTKLLQTFRYQSLIEVKELTAEIGAEIRRDGLPSPLVPFICGFTGYGHVSQGAQEMYDLLPVEEVTPEEFRKFLAWKNFSAHRVYKVVFREEHMVRRKDQTRPFDLREYYDHPEDYEPVLEPFLLHLTVLVNGIYWAPKYPRFVTKAFIRALFGKAERPRLKVIGDISCDIEGGVECTIEATSPRDPVYVYDAATGRSLAGVEGNGPVIMAVDNLPAEMSLESSVFFSQCLKPFLPDIGVADFRGTFEDCRLPEPVRKAVILFKGEFTPAYRYMKAFLEPS